MRLVTWRSTICQAIPAAASAASAAASAATAAVDALLPLEQQLLHSLATLRGRHHHVAAIVPALVPTAAAATAAGAQALLLPVLVQAGDYLVRAVEAQVEIKSER